MTIYFLSFLFGAIHVVNYVLCSYNFIRNFVALKSPKSER